MHCLLLELRTGSREEQRLVGGACALGLASCLTGAPLASLAWRRACPLSKPQVTAAAAAPAAPLLPLLPVNLSHEGRLLAVAFLPPAPAQGAQQRCLGVDVQGVARAARALASAAATGDATGEALLRGGSCTGAGAGALPTPRALASGSGSSGSAGGGAASPLLFAARWTLMEAVLKARGQGLAVQGAGAAVLASALEEGEGGQEGEGAAAPLAPVLWGARAPPGGWSVESVQGAAAAAAAAATATATATAPGAGGPGCAQGLERVPHAVLARFRGRGWQAATCTLAWPPACPQDASEQHTSTTTDILTLALLD
jgi:hypothetical protein